MRKTLALAIVALSMLSAHHADAATLSKSPNSLGLVGYWPFDEGTSTVAGDFSGNGANGALTNIANPSTAASGWQASGKRGKAIAFDGSNDYVDMGNVGAYSTNFTVSAWIYKGTAFGNSVNGWTVFTKRNNSTAGWQLDTSSTGRLIWRTFNGGSQFSRQGSVSLATGRWYHVTAVHTSGNVALYINGALDTSGAITDPAIDSTTFKVGHVGAGSGSVYWDGLEDEVRLYSRALSAAEVLALYQSGPGVQRSTDKTSLIGYWPMNEGTSTQAADLSGFGNTGTLAGTGTPSWVAGKRTKALLFDGVDDYVNIPGFNRTVTQATFTAWIKTAAHGGYKEIIFSRGANVTGMNLSAVGNRLGYTWNDVVASYNWAGGPVIPLNRWVFVAVSVSPTQATAYLYDPDTNTLSSGTNVLAHATTTINALRLGFSSCCGGRYFSGTMDDARIYDRALTQAEVVAIYKAGEATVNAPQNDRYTNGLVANWTFNGQDMADARIADVSGNGSDAFVVGTAATSSLKGIGKVGQALSLNGTNNYLSPPASSSSNTISTNRVTVSAWVNPATSSSIMTVISNDRDCGGCGTYRGFGMQIFYGGTTLFRVWNDNGSGPYTASTGQLPPVGEWTHIVGTFDGSAVRLYMNGALVSTNSSVGNGTLGFPSTFNTKIGQLGCCTNTYTMNGRIDEVRVYNRALSLAEVKQLYNLGR